MKLILFNRLDYLYSGLVTEGEKINKIKTNNVHDVYASIETNLMYHLSNAPIRLLLRYATGYYCMVIVFALCFSIIKVVLANFVVIFCRFP